MPSEAEQRILDGSVWHEFCDRLRDAGDAVLRDSTPADAFTRAEGFRYLTRMLRAGLDAFLEHGDPRRPAFFQFSNELIKIGKAGRNMEGQAPADPRCGNEPGRPPAWWWRRPHLWWASRRIPVG